MKISELIQQLATVQMERGDVPVMMEFLSIPDDEVAIMHETLPTHYEEIEEVICGQNGFRFFAQLTI
jgi:hypothetical protein